VFGYSIKSKVYNYLEFRYLVCENQKNRTRHCSVTAYVSANLNDNVITVLGQHNHDPR